MSTASLLSHKADAMMAVAGPPARLATGLAAGVGFEPTSPRGLPGYKPGPFSHSGNPPLNPTSKRYFFVESVERIAVYPLIERSAFMLDRGNLPLFFQPLKRRVNDGQRIPVLVERKSLLLKLAPDICWSKDIFPFPLKDLTDGICDAKRLFFHVFSNEMTQTQDRLTQLFAALSNLSKAILELCLFVQQRFEFRSCSFQDLFVALVSHDLYGDLHV